MSRELHELIQRIQDCTFRVDIEVPSDTRYNQNGTAFAVSANTLLTAFHVVEVRENHEKGRKVYLSNSKGDRIEGKVKKGSKEADLAVIEIDSDFDVSNPFDRSDNPPDVGTKCIWGGFPKLIGEYSIRQIRFARGMVCSEIYPVQEGLFFKVDGIFNPGHSGSAIINIETGELIGVASRSAGELGEHFSKASYTIQAIRTIQSSWQLFEDTRQSVDKTLQALEKAIPVIDEGFKEVFRCLSYVSPGHWSGLKVNIPWFPFGSTNWSKHIETFLPTEVIRILKEKGIEVSKWDSDDGPTQMIHLRAESDVAWKALIQLILEWTDSMKEAVHDSFQMGIGIATCGEPLRRLLP